MEAKLPIRIFILSKDENFSKWLTAYLKLKFLGKDIQFKTFLDTEKCFVRKTGMTYHVDLHVIVDGSISVEEGHAISHKLKDHLQNKLPQIADILIHIEPDSPHIK